MNQIETINKSIGINDYKNVISAKYGIPIELITAETEGEINNQVNALVQYRRTQQGHIEEPDMRASAVEHFAGWFENASKNDSLKNIFEQDLDAETETGAVDQFAMWFEEELGNDNSVDEFFRRSQTVEVEENLPIPAYPSVRDGGEFAHEMNFKTNEERQNELIQGIGFVDNSIWARNITRL